MKLKEAYLKQVPAPPKEIKDHNRDIEKYDKDFTKYTILRKKSLKALIRKLYTKKKTILQSEEQYKTFNAIKNAILTNAVTSPNPNL